MKHIDVAISQIGVKEDPIGSNWGKEVSAYLQSVGINFQASWCMAFVYWCVQNSGIVNPLIKTGGCMAQWNKIPIKYKFVDPKPGDVFIQDHGKGLGHTGIIESIEGSKIHTIEGNTNDTGSREGYEVCRRTREIKSCMGFIRIV